ncbi:acyl-CoA dehydrogenase family protein [Rhodococcoides yunnanense]|jgi:alkylation response protein AidB-like acyl-CoA dehydrogenase|uniref:acyl-CoA dehydrogenase family protein n=1 Tax=Rhodococcoides yunnanense TaxID=278209 RepID=UPI0022B1F956|nr:acyl-CoA dehydrogenase family protein [Rhodococcus yunnanensis]MCZ4274610.1 acyl-CoA/acyl-ACP dehydrogenase [Rhodococcus yunnanensis]
MDFTTTEAQRDLAGLTGDIVAKHSTGEAQRRLDSNPSDIDRPLWDALAQAGLLAAAAPESIGGDGYGILEATSITIELGRGLAAVPFVASTTAAGAIAEFGSPEQQLQWARAATTGASILTVALDDSPLRPATALTSVDSAPVADGILLARESGAVLLKSTEPGVTVTTQQAVDNRSIGMVEFDSTAFDSSRTIESADLARWVRMRVTLGTCAYQVGVLEEALRVTAEYARERVQFGKPIGSFQAVAQRLADAYIDVKGARLTMWQAAWALSAGLDGDEEVAVAKFWAAEAGHRVAHTLVHVHGGVGLDRDHPVHRYFLAAKRAEFAYGGATAALRRLGSALASA